jgi:hypothetical protein
MKIYLKNTSKVVTLLQEGAQGVPTRIWKGHTESGIEVHAYVALVAVKHDADQSEFERELIACEEPSAAVEAIPLVLIL